MGMKHESSWGLIHDIQPLLIDAIYLNNRKMLDHVDNLLYTDQIFLK